MKLHIENFAKIKKADITVDGITIIAGENNTGKSTVGKILFSLFNSLFDIGDNVVKERLREIERTNRIILQGYLNEASASRVWVSRNVNRIAQKIKLRIEKDFYDEISISEQKLKKIIKEEIERSYEWPHSENLHMNEKVIDDVAANIQEVLEISERDIIMEVVSQYFNRVFHSQINSLTGSCEEESILNLEIKDKKETLFFTDNQCTSYEDGIHITHRAIYIDNPFIVDELMNDNEQNPMNKLLVDLLTRNFKEDIMDGVIGAVRTKEKLDDIYLALRNVVDGEIMYNPNDEFYLKSSKISEPVSFHNLSAGMKSFIILKMLLEKGALKGKDVVILDEPEIHLHPQWQIAYAELIVLLQKHFDLSIVVTTHSPYFVDAINLFSCKYGVNDKVNYYLAVNETGKSIMKDVTGNIDLIYKKMASPIQILDTLRYELNHN